VSDVKAAGMLKIPGVGQPAMVWVTDTYDWPDDGVNILTTDEYTLWSYIVLVPDTFARREADNWPWFLAEIGQLIVATKLD